MLEQTNLDTDIELLEKSKMAAIANAEFQAMMSHVGSDTQSEECHSVFGAKEHTLLPPPVQKTVRQQHHLCC